MIWRSKIGYQRYAPAQNTSLTTTLSQKSRGAVQKGTIPLFASTATATVYRLLGGWGDSRLPTASCKRCPRPSHLFGNHSCLLNRRDGDSPHARRRKSNDGNAFAGIVEMIAAKEKAIGIVGIVAAIVVLEIQERFDNCFAEIAKLVLIIFEPIT